MKRIRDIVTVGVVGGLLAACSSEPEEAAPPADDVAAEATAEEAEATEPEAEEVAAVPEVEPNGTVIRVEMLNADPNDRTETMVFRPAIVKAKVGDTITFVPTDPSHQAQSIDGMVPEGVEGFKSAFNEEYSYVVPTPGVYGYKCLPHYGAGMIGLIIVEGEGMTDNLEAAKGVSHPGRAGTRFKALFEEAEASGDLS